MKHMKLMALLALGLMVCPVYARNESGWGKKTARVLFYGVESCAGWHFLTTFHNRHPQSLWPCDIAHKIWKDKRNAGSEAVASAVLLWHGLRGLDRELHISKQFKK